MNNDEREDKELVWVCANCGAIEPCYGTGIPPQYGCSVGTFYSGPKGKKNWTEEHDWHEEWR